MSNIEKPSHGEAIARKSAESTYDLIRSHWKQMEDIADRAGKTKTGSSVKFTFERVGSGEVRVTAKISYFAKNEDERVDIVDIDSDQIKIEGVK